VLVEKAAAQAAAELRVLVVEEQEGVSSGCDLREVIEQAGVARLGWVVISIEEVNAVGAKWVGAYSYRNPFITGIGHAGKAARKRAPSGLRG